MYQLYGVLVHQGMSSNSGHYYCYVKGSDKMWYTMNDNFVSIPHLVPDSFSHVRMQSSWQNRLLPLVWLTDGVHSRLHIYPVRDRLVPYIDTAFNVSPERQAKWGEQRTTVPNCPRSFLLKHLLNFVVLLRQAFFGLSLGFSAFPFSSYVDCGFGFAVGQ